MDDHVSWIPVEKETKIMMLLKVLEVDDHVSWMHAENENERVIVLNVLWR